jgi:phosphate-selective porin OprO/OprP
VKAPESATRSFHGGELLFAWIVTGETRPYNVRNAYFDRITPARSVFTGPRRMGNRCAVLVQRHGQRSDSRGTFWRFTPMVNWHMSANLRLEFVYGYSSLDRFGTVGKTQYFQIGCSSSSRQAPGSSDGTC